ncbi:protein kinase domain-containing protein [Leptothermofonsia sp. ETS-13]|uniref:protein kinase domain-containing protein n=1 Tax=Leptothermofonsia sp. ETS-13 TaxID=3035696 RepID=UPI003BA21D99
MAPLYCSQGHENLEDSRFCRQCGERLNPVTEELYQGGIVGRTLSFRYRVLRELGHGGFGRTYLAEDINRFHEPCVLKEFAPQVQGSQDLQKAEELFEREAGILYQLQHPQIPRFRELFRAEFQGRGRLFLVQDYVEGQTYQAILRSRQSQGFCFSETEVTQLLFQLLPVLTYIHERGVIHRDISPDNLIWRSADGLPVLIDFGGVKQVAAEVISQVNPARVAQPSGATLLGKIGYAPVEQIAKGEAFPHSDLYALAMTVLVLLTGKAPQDLLEDNHWQKQVRLSPQFMSILNRMLEPYPVKRFQSAQEVLRALKGGVPKPRHNITQPPVEYQSGQKPYPATIAVALPAKTELSQFQTLPPVPVRSRRGSGFVGFFASLLFVAGLVGSGWWAGNRWLLPLLPISQENQVKPQKPGPQPTPSNPLEPTFSKAEQTRKEKIIKRREELGIDNTFFVGLVNQVFHAKHPELEGRQLSRETKDKVLRSEWDKIATDLLDRLQTISPEARSRMGQYTEASIQARQTTVNQLNLSSRALNDLTDAQFFSLFPEQPRENLLKQPVGQVWQAIADDQLKALRAGTALEAIQFPEGSFSHQLNGSLKPGQGKAYTAQLAKEQMIRLKLQTDSPSARISFYLPTSKSAALLEDSSEREWSGKLTETGLYEVVIVATGSDPVNYTLDLGAAEEVNTGGEN